MKHQGQLIAGITPGSIAEELEIRPGDRLLSINGQEITDIFDYDFLCEDRLLPTIFCHVNVCHIVSHRSI